MLNQKTGCPTNDIWREADDDKVSIVFEKVFDIFFWITALSAMCWWPVILFLLRHCVRGNSMKSSGTYLCVLNLPRCVLSPLLFVFYAKWVDSYRYTTCWYKWRQQHQTFALCGIIGVSCFLSTGLAAYVSLVCQCTHSLAWNSISMNKKQRSPLL